MKLVTIKEACKKGVVGRTRLYQLIDAGVIKAYKVRGRTMIDMRGFDGWDKPRPMPAKKKLH